MVRKILKKIIKGYLRDLYWNIKGFKCRNPSIPVEARNIVFICKGNICRSAFAHQLMVQHQLFQKDLTPIIISAGLEARKGNHSPDTAIIAARQFDVDLSIHRAEPLTLDMADSADMMIAMEPEQVKKIIQLYPQRAKNVFLMSELEKRWDASYSGWEKFHIQDPYGRDKIQFIRCFERLSRCVEGLMTTYLSKNGNPNEQDN